MAVKKLDHVWLTEMLCINEKQKLYWLPIKFFEVRNGARKYAKDIRISDCIKTRVIKYTR